MIQAPHRAHWQPVEYNALHGGFERWFEPLHGGMATDAAFLALLQGLAGVASDLRAGVSRWFVEAHAFRIDCTDGIGRPTPEGAHRDGVDLVAVILLGRHHIRGDFQWNACLLHDFFHGLRCGRCQWRWRGGGCRRSRRLLRRCR